MKETNLINRSEIFRALRDEEVSRLTPLFFRHEAAKEERIFDEGGEATHLYIVIDGAIGLQKRVRITDGKYVSRTVVATCKPGEVFGWSALVEPHEYTLSATAWEPTSLIRIEAASMRTILDEDSSIGYKVHTALAAVVSRRLRQLSHALTYEREMVMSRSVSMLR